EIAEGLEPFYEAAIADLLEQMGAFPGYASGESLKDLRHPNRYVVVTRWQNKAAWDRWLHSEARRDKSAELRPFLLGDEKITLLRQLSYYRVDPANP
ncbi:MAG: antibiotic biosynthesis monooxygenase, partial [candidate division Zixibacteria bacterium]|nr:antibiotic biosynthesis monooxygenase [candidate division Zixibacteria bacterium]